jgi:hypothetical protein
MAFHLSPDIQNIVSDKYLTAYLSEFRLNITKIFGQQETCKPKLQSTKSSQAISQVNAELKNKCFRDLLSLHCHSHYDE